MIPCTNKPNGCPKGFSNNLGLRTHLRSCRWNISSSQVQKKKIISLPVTLGGDQPRLRCDKAVFDDEFLAETENQESGIVIDNSIQSTQQLDVSSDYCDLSEVERKTAKLLAKITRRLGKKDVDDLLCLLRMPTFELSRFTQTFPFAASCTKLIANTIEHEANKFGFQKRTIKDDISGYSYDLYVRSPVEVLRSQIRGSCSSSTIFDPLHGTTTNDVSAEQICHPMMAKLGKEGVPAVKRYISEQGGDVYWRVPALCGESSFVGMVQMFSDKSKTSLKESSFQFYPLHLTLLNFSEEHRRKYITDGLTFVAFLPVSFAIDGDKSCEKGIPRNIRMKLLHESLQHSLQELKDVCISGFSCLDVERKKRFCHPCLAAYCCDLPEAKDIASVKNGNSSLRNCHRCMSETSNFNSYTTSAPRTGSKTREVILNAHELQGCGMRKAAEDLLSNYSLSNQLPFLIDFPFVGLNSVLDLHQLFPFEAIHNFHLGISKDLKRFIPISLRSDVKLTSNIPTANGTNRISTLKSLRMPILNGINKLLTYIQDHSPAKGLHIDFSNRSKNCSGNGLYGADGTLLGMLEAKDYRSLDMVFPFVGMFLDRCCDEEMESPHTNLFVQYVEIMTKAMNYDGNMGWTELRLQKLEKDISTFKSNALSLFGECSASELCTEKFHLLDHITEDIRRLGGLRSVEAGLYEYSHTLVKSAYRSGSKRKSSAMEESVFNFTADLVENREPVSVNSLETSGVRKTTTPVCIPKYSRKEAIDGDCAALTRKGQNFTLKELEKCRIVFRSLRKAREEENHDVIMQQSKIWKMQSAVTRQCIQDIGEDGTRILIHQLRKRLHDEDRIQKDCTITRVASAFVAGRSSSAVRYNPEKDGIMIKESDMRCSQRIVSSGNFYKSGLLRQDCILIEGEDENQENCIWVGKVLGLFRIRDAELCFVQYFEVVPPKDYVDEALQCIKLVWAKGEVAKSSHTHQQNNERFGVSNRHFPNGAVAEELSSGVEHHSKWFDILDPSTIRGLVHVVRGDFGSKGRGIVKDMDMVPWQDRHFYINRFYYDTSQRTYSNSE